MGQLDYGMLAAYAVGIILLYIIGKSVSAPLKFFGKLVFNLIVGSVILIFINYLGGYINFHIGLNVVTALIVGFLGIPGVVLVIILTKLFGL